MCSTQHLPHLPVHPPTACVPHRSTLGPSGNLGRFHPLPGPQLLPNHASNVQITGDGFHKHFLPDTILRASVLESKSETEESELFLTLLADADVGPTCKQAVCAMGRALSRRVGGVSERAGHAEALLSLELACCLHQFLPPFPCELHTRVRWLAAPGSFLSMRILKTAGSGCHTEPRGAAEVD